MIIYEASTRYKKVGEMTSPALLNEPRAAIDYMRGAFRDFPRQEQVWILVLTKKNHIMARERVAIGATSSCSVDPSICFRPCIVQGGSAIIIVHNHPSGDPTPSLSDVNMAKRLHECGKVLDIEVHDFIIIGDPQNHYSFNDKGLI
jgi:DNA repair protein RadC